MLIALRSFSIVFLLGFGRSLIFSDLYDDDPDEPDKNLREFDIDEAMEGRDADHRFSYTAAYDMKKLFPDQTCVPQTFGYSLETASKVFPEYIYPRCEERYEGKEIPWISLDLPNNRFTLHCTSNSTEQYITGPGKLMTFPKKDELYPQIKIKDLDGRVGVIGPDDEYIVASCYGKFDVIEQWVRPNVKDYERVSAARDQTRKPILIYMLVVDSFSRRHFFQKLPETVEYLSNLGGEDYVVEDFKLHNVIGDGSAHNTLPIFCKGYDTHEIERRNYEDNLGDEAIWVDMKKHNFMNLLMTEACDQQFPVGIGRFPKIDHVSRQIYCALSTISDYHSAKNDISKQRCVGPNMSHWYAFDYVKKFVKTYEKANQWIYSHLTAAHEASGQHAQTIDHDLVVFLKELLEMTKDTHEVVIFLHGDHGMRFGEWRRDLAAVQEHKLPAFFLIGSRHLIENIPGAVQTIRHNTWKLFSKKDIRRTLLWLAQYPHFQTLPLEDSLQHTNILVEPLPLNRTCQDAGVPVWYCSCLELKSVELNEHYLGLAEYLVDYAIELMNREIYSKNDRPIGTVCEKIWGGKVLSLAGMKATNTEKIFRIDFSVGNKADSQFSATMLLSPQPYNGAVKSWQEKYYLGGIDPFAFESTRNFVKVISLSRMDKFEGPCEDLSRKEGLKADYCFCRDIEAEP
mmetsp:Transcript_33360/g.58498  ORF Transcript_33360/g.58498 Transcript_33360/m.58498 type:complete len:682 (+) Transcript_33360:466-2511(+)